MIILKRQWPAKYLFTCHIVKYQVDINITHHTDVTLVNVVFFFPDPDQVTHDTFVIHGRCLASIIPQYDVYRRGQNIAPNDLFPFRR